MYATALPTLRHVHVPRVGRDRYTGNDYFVQELHFVQNQTDIIYPNISYAILC